jgi:hypothetical protein
MCAQVSGEWRDKEPSSRPGRDKFRPASTKRGESGVPSRLPSRSAQGRQGKQAAALQKKSRLEAGATKYETSRLSPGTIQQW